MEKQMVSHDPMYAIQLSVCVIGRNEGRNLPTCIASLNQLDTLQLSYETIFVDSASTDDSVVIAQSGFDKVLCLAPSTFLNAGAARHVGTQHAKGEWVLYMDGDMALAPAILTAISDLICSGRFDEGLCGFTENCYSDGRRDLINFRGNRHGLNCRMFGGAVLLPRRKVLEAGNWSCALYAYEECELYCRILHCGVNVIWYDRLMVEHRTPEVSLIRKILGAIITYRSYLGKKFYGAGQVTLLTLRNGNFRGLVSLKPEAHLMLASVFIAIAAAPWLSYVAGSVPIVTFCFITLRESLRCAVNYTCWLLQLAFGVWMLHPDFHPTVQQIRMRSELTAVDRGFIG